MAVLTRVFGACAAITAVPGLRSDVERFIGRYGESPVKTRPDESSDDEADGLRNPWIFKPDPKADAPGDLDLSQEPILPIAHDSHDVEDSDEVIKSLVEGLDEKTTPEPVNHPRGDEVRDMFRPHGSLHKSLDESLPVKHFYTDDSGFLSEDDTPLRKPIVDQDEETKEQPSQLQTSMQVLTQRPVQPGNVVQQAQVNYFHSVLGSISEQPQAPTTMMSAQPRTTGGAGKKNKKKNGAKTVQSNLPPSIRR